MRKKKMHITTGELAILLIFLVLISIIVNSTINKKSNKEISKSSATAIEKSLGHCIDGDTFSMNMRNKSGSTTEISYRLANIDTPEKGQDGYQEALEFTCEWINIHSFVIIPGNKDKYGRTIAEIIDKNSNQNLSEELVKKCLAEPFWANTNNKIKDLYAENCY